MTNRRSTTFSRAGKHDGIALRCVWSRRR